MSEKYKVKVHCRGKKPERTWQAVLQIGPTAFPFGPVCKEGDWNVPGVSPEDMVQIWVNELLTALATIVPEGGVGNGE